MEDDFKFQNYSSYATDLDVSSTSLGSSTATGSSFASSARSSFSCSSSSLAVSFKDLVSIKLQARPHGQHDPSWSAIRAATNLSGDGRLHLRHLKVIRQIGAGDVGRVFLCRVREGGNAQFALKVVDRHSLSATKACHVETEARILWTLDHPFLPTLYSQISASHYTCLLIDYCPGGDLNTLLRRQPLGRLPLHAVRFYAAEVLVALEYLHSKGIVYRDLKPENILVRESGHIMLSDFDLCFTSQVTPRIDHQDDLFVAEPTLAYSKSFVGTHEYLAPELLTGNGYGNAVDWWAFGVLVYELMYGTTPFKGVNKESTVRHIASANMNVRFPGGGGGSEWVARDLIQQLLVKDPARRLGGARGAADIKRHPFFEGVKWPLIRSYTPPEIVKGVVSRKKRSKPPHVTKRRSFWRAITRLLRKPKASSSSMN